MLKVELQLFINENYEFFCNPLYKGFLGKIRAYVDKIDFEENTEENTCSYREIDPLRDGAQQFLPEELQKHIEQSRVDTSFGRALMKILRHKKKDPVKVYKKARIDRKLFSKIRTQERYVPSKRTIIALSLGAELNYEETQALLSVAGLTLSHYILFDVIVEFYIKNGIYDIDSINISLNEYKQQVIE